MTDDADKKAIISARYLPLPIWGVSIIYLLFPHRKYLNG
jgi:hypothetical protein